MHDLQIGDKVRIFSHYETGRITDIIVGEDIIAYDVHFDHGSILSVTCLARGLELVD